MLNKLAVLSIAVLLGACAIGGSLGALNQLTPDQKKVFACEGAASTMRVVENFIRNKTITHKQTLIDIADASQIITQTCLSKTTDPIEDLRIITYKAVYLMDARKAAEGN